jgi:small-conductance mechanosensitive channel
VLSNPPFEVVVDDLGDNSVRLLVFPYVALDNYWAVRNVLREQIKARFDTARIHFALRERNVRFPAGIQDETLTRAAYGDHAPAP